MSEQRVALMTGANRGIGLEVCRQLAGRGLRVVLTARDPNKGQAAADGLIANGLDVTFLPLDVSDPAAAEAARVWVEGRYGRLDVLVNNAAVYLDDNVSIFDVPLSTFDKTLAANLYGPLHLCRAFVPGMRQRGYGRVVNVSSESGQLSTMGGYTAAYAISKTALNGLTRVVAAEAGQAVKVNAVCPGWVRTDMGGPHASRSVAEGADTIVWLATLPDSGPTGGFFQDRRPIAW
ncbi:MAG: SDR family oxidoreductase [Candidatus Promineofilum sp.]|nr:SDR family oxidoreductase [Promineifilum sp.]